MPPRIDLVGRKFGRLTVTDFVGFYRGHSHWECRCDCGGNAVATSCNLVRGNTMSCGCVQKMRTSLASTKHGLSRHPVYRVWRQMINRCENSKDIMFHRYGGRGIGVCAEWHVFENFIKDMGLPPKLRLDIDRIDNDDGYRKDNCRWVSRSVNSRNKSGTIRLPWEGRMVPLIDLG